MKMGYNGNQEENLWENQSANAKTVNVAKSSKIKNFSDFLNFGNNIRYHFVIII